MTQRTYGPRRVPAVERFWPKVDRSAGPDACWPWTASIGRNGYGKFTDDSRRMIPAHRFALLVTTGQLLDDLVVDHLCRNRACCNPAHLEAVTHAENMRRARRPTCKRGHPMVPENVGSKRMCNMCQRLRARGWHRIGDAALCGCGHPLDWHADGRCCWPGCACRRELALADTP